MYLFPNRVEMAGCERVITMVATGTTRSAAYLTENR